MCSSVTLYIQEICRPRVINITNLNATLRPLGAVLLNPQFREIYKSVLWFI